MNKELTELENVIAKLEQTISLFNCLYLANFRAESNISDPAIPCKDYTNSIGFIKDSLQEQIESLHKIMSNLYDTKKAFRANTNQNLAILKGSEINE